MEIAFTVDASRLIMSRVILFWDRNRNEALHSYHLTSYIGHSKIALFTLRITHH